MNESNILFVGDSHFQRGIDPSHFVSAENIAQLGEPYIITYWKLKKMLSILKPDTVVIGFGPHNITSAFDNKFSDHKSSSEMFKRSYLIGNLKETEGLEIDEVELAQVVLQEMCLFPRKQHINYIGRYEGTSRKREINPKGTAEKYYFSNDEVLKSSETSIFFLGKIVKLLKSQDITPILIRTPIHTSYLHLIPPSFKQTYNEQKEKFEQEGIMVLDYSGFPLSDSLFLDVDHLNNEGAQLFTKQLIEDIYD